MNSSIQLTAGAVLVAMAAFVAGTAHAQAAYVGLSRTTPGEFYADFAKAKHVQNQTDPLALKFYGGLNLTERYALEIGYGAFGSWTVTDPTPGSTQAVRSDSKLLYVAGKASLPLGASFVLFGKLGIAANKVTQDSGMDGRSSVTFVRPMGGFGIEYKFTEHAGAVLEYNYYGNRGKTFRQQKLELGLKYAF